MKHCRADCVAKSCAGVICMCDQRAAVARHYSELRLTGGGGRQPLLTVFQPNTYKLMTAIMQHSHGPMTVDPTTTSQSVRWGPAHTPIIKSGGRGGGVNHLKKLVLGESGFQQLAKQH